MKKFNSIILLTMVGGLLSLSFSTRALTQKERAAKARYYYMEGVRMQSEGEDPEMYEMYKHAWKVAPDYAEAASAYGSARLGLDNDSVVTPDEMLNSLALMRQFVDKYPDDFNESQYYAYVASQLDTLPEAIRVYERLAELCPEKSVTLLRLADAYVADGDTHKALEALNRYEKIEGKSFALSTRKVSFMLSVGDTVGAKNEARELIEYNPKGIDAYQLKGALYESIALPDSALENYKIAERLDPANGLTKMLMANYFKTRGDSVNYDAKIYELLLSEDYDLDQKLNILGGYLRNLLSDKGNTQRGDSLFNVLSRQYPYEPGILDLEARYEYEKGNYSAAKEKIASAIDLAPDVEDYYGSMMSYQVETDDYKGAVATYDRAARHVEPGEGLKLILASACSMDGDYERAEKVFGGLIEEVIPSAPLNDSITLTPEIRNLDYTSLMRGSVLYGLLGDMYYQAKNAPKAFLAYENAIKLMPYNYMTLNNYAYFLAQKGDDIAKAENMSKQAVDANPDQSTFLDTYAYILFRQGKYKEALEYQQKAVDTELANGKNPGTELYDHLGDILFFCDDLKGAVDAWRKALEISPDNKIIKKKIDTESYIPEEEQ